MWSPFEKTPSDQIKFQKKISAGDISWLYQVCGREGGGAFSRYRVVWGGTQVISLRWGEVGDNRGGNGG